MFGQFFIIFIGAFNKAIYIVDRGFISGGGFSRLLFGGLFKPIEAFVGQRVDQVGAAFALFYYWQTQVEKGLHSLQTIFTLLTHDRAQQVTTEYLVHDCITRQTSVSYRGYKSF